MNILNDKTHEDDVNKNSPGDSLSSLAAHVDINRLFLLAGNDLSFINNLLYLANEENMKEIVVAQTQAREGDRVALARTIHRLKGSAQTICAKEIAAACVILESQQLAKMSVEDIHSGLKKIELLISSLDRCLRDLR